MYNALVIGCGSIGALYDLNSDQIHTHSKAFFMDKRFNLSVFDINTTLAKKISGKYQCDRVDHLDEKILASFDVVSICSPTATHYELLRTSILADVKLIICEKPVSYDPAELKELKKLYRTGNSKVMVNYIRRFQPAFARLKKRMVQLLKKETLTNITVRYQRGFIHNCSHAFDTIEYLMGSPLNLSDIKLSNRVPDHFKNDETLSLQAAWGNVNINITGLSNVSFSFFEIDLYFEYHRISIKNSGRTIEVYKAVKGKQFLQPLAIENEISDNGLNNYMKYVIEHGYSLLAGKIKEDNFIGSVDLNERMLKYIKR